MENQEKFNKIFKAKASAMVEQPPAKVWNRLDNKLQRKNKRVKLRRLKVWSIAASLIGVLGFSTFMMQQFSERHDYVSSSSVLIEMVELDVSVQPNSQMASLSAKNYPTVEEGTKKSLMTPKQAAQKRKKLIYNPQ